jgi:transposase
MNTSKNRKELSAALFKKIRPMLPIVQPSPKGGRPRVNDEMALNGILYVMRTGIPWEDLPQELGFGSGMTCWRRLRQWQADGVWPELHQLLLAELRGANRMDFSRVKRRLGGVPATAPAQPPAPPAIAVPDGNKPHAIDSGGPSFIPFWAQIPVPFGHRAWQGESRAHPAISDSDTEEQEDS